MFGGYGLYCEDTIIALIAFERLYLKVDAETKPAFAAAGAAAFVYDGKSKPIAMPYMTLPPEIESDPVAFLPFAERALAAGRRAKASKRAKAGGRR